ncbi:MAG TPA: PadR family transcriptional regulator [Microcella sp.]|nr:PadR family transcriptional regulator [Microcella sp.]
MSSRLTPASFWILTALSTERRHGYDILLDVEKASGGDVSLKVPTLYAALERLERSGLVARDGDEIVNGRARRYFRLTDDGEARLTAEAAELERQLALVRQRLAASASAAPRPRPLAGGALGVVGA